MFQKNDVISWQDTSYRILAYVNEDVVLFPMNEDGIGLKTEAALVLDAAEK